MSGIDAWTQDIHQGDVVEVLQQLPESSVHMAMCSPPYYGLRDYGVEGQIGLEESLTEYIDSLVEVGQELRRVLRPDGNWWLNLGDSFAGSWGAQSKDETSNNLPQHDFPDKNPARNAALGRKQKMLVPARIAIALQESGWVVRGDYVWAKPNPMPDPVTDRLREDKEFIFHLTPEPDYWFDLDAIREPHAESSLERNGRHDHTERAYPGQSPQTLNPDQFVHPRGKNPGDILEVTVKPFPEAHFAVYPPELCEAPIKSSCPPAVCGECGTPYERPIVETPPWELEDPTRPQLKRALELADEYDLTDAHLEACRAVGFSDAAAGQEQSGYGRNTDDVEALAAEAKDALGGYFREFTTVYETPGDPEPTCDCDAGSEPGIVLDPFAGAGTTCLVAKRLNRRFIGIDLNAEYVAMAQRRVGVTVDEPELLLDDDQPALSTFTD